MIRLLNAAVGRVLRRLYDGPRCPACSHDQNVHGEKHCLAALYDKDGNHDAWCSCPRTYGKAVSTGGAS